MKFGRIIGTVVSTQIDKGIKGRKCLLVQECNYKGEKIKGNYIIALDLVGAGIGEMILLSQGSSARQTEITFEKPVDAVIIGIVDLIEKDHQIVFKK